MSCRARTSPRRSQIAPRRKRAPRSSPSTSAASCTGSKNVAPYFGPWVSLSASRTRPGVEQRLERHRHRRLGDADAARDLRARDRRAGADRLEHGALVEVAQERRCRATCQCARRCRRRTRAARTPRSAAAAPARRARARAAPGTRATSRTAPPGSSALQKTKASEPSSSITSTPAVEPLARELHRLGPHADDRLRAAVRAQARELERQPAERGVAVVVERHAAEVHRRRPDEAGHERVHRVVEQRARRVALLQLRVAQDGDAVAERHRLRLVVGDVDGRDAEPRLQLGDVGAHLHAQLGVEVGERLVHQEDLGLADDRAPHRHALALAAGELARLALEQRRQLELLGDLAHALLALGLRHPRHPQREADVGGDREVRVERVVLEHHRDVAALRRVVADVALADVDPRRRRPPRARRASAARSSCRSPTGRPAPSARRRRSRGRARRPPARRCRDRSASPARSAPQPCTATSPSSLRARASASGPAPSSSSPSSAAPTIGSEAATRSSTSGAEAGLDRAQQAPVAGPEHPAAEQHLDGRAAELEPLDRGVHEREHLGGEPVDDRGGDRVGRGGVEHQRRQLDDPPLRDAAEVDRLDELAGRGEAEVLGHRALEPRSAGRGRPRCAPPPTARRGRRRSRRPSRR